MTALMLTKTRMKQGLWEGIVTRVPPGAEPRIEVTHENAPVPDVALTPDAQADHWLLSIPIPPEAIADGVQTLLIHDMDADQTIGHVTLLSGDDIDDDLRGEVALLRAELDLLKRVVRRHCIQTE